MELKITYTKKIAEYVEYNVYVENCKLQAKAFIAERNAVLNR